MARRMSDKDFLADQCSRLHEAHIAPITGFVDSLRTPKMWLPYVAPMHGGVNARMLTILRDPGKGTLYETGSGMLSVENDDQTAETQFGLMEQAGLTPADFTPWNAYPWFIDRNPTDAELLDASPTLVGLLELLPNLVVVMLQGGQAQAAWRIALEAQPSLRRRRLITLETYHPSVQALRTPSPEERARRIQHRIDAWREASEILNG
jgi:Uracil DNA glycosylase superfamily.